MYKNKYLKYKNKYLELKNQSGGATAAGGESKGNVSKAINPPSLIILDFSELIDDTQPIEIITRTKDLFKDLFVKQTTTEQTKNVFKFTTTIQTNLVRQFIEILTSNTNIIVSDFNPLSGGRLILDYSYISNKMRETTRKIIFKFYFNTDQNKLKINGYLDLQNIEKTYKTLYKCDYNFTNVQYRNINNELVRINTIFDSGNDAITLIDNASIDSLRLQRYGINIKPINVLKFNRLFETKKIDINESDLNVLTGFCDRMTINNFITSYIVPNANEIRRRHNLAPNLVGNYEDLLELCGFTSFRGIGGNSTISKEFVLLGFHIEGFDKNFYIKAEINDNIEGVLFSKHDMALLEKQGLSFGYFSAFQQKHDELVQLKERYKMYKTQYELSEINTIFGNKDLLEREMIQIRHQINYILEHTTTPVVNIYDTLPVCRSGVTLSRSISLNHTEIEYIPNEEQKQIVIEKLSTNDNANQIKGLLIEMIISNQFTEEQLKKMNDELSKNL